MVRDLTGKHAQYYEAILQLRDVSTELVEVVYAEVERLGMRIAQALDLENGVDVYLTDKSLTKTLARKLQENFGGEYKESTSIFGQKDGNEITRLTILFRGIGAKKGDIVEYKGDQYQIRILGKDVLLQEVSTGKKIHLKYEDMKKLKKC
ncbi:hypothetical protein HZC30_00805 [Candidatus Woesearchaeota archaeon]|nr:hypothetical protein [Candidatus Woesearchaeota archaeon]